LFIINISKIIKMATKLDRDLTRETSLKANDKEIMITITKNQSILLKLKGERGKHYEINILDLFNELSGTPGKKQEKPTKKNPSILLHDLRAHSAIADMDYETKAKFDQIIKKVIDEI